MFNLIYHLIFRDCKNETLWQHIMTSTVNQEETLPIVYYKAFKYSKFFLEAHFPEWEMVDYLDKFYYSE